MQIFLFKIFNQPGDCMKKFFSCIFSHTSLFWLFDSFWMHIQNGYIYIYIFCVNLKKLLGSFLSTAIFLLSAPTPYVSINIFKVFHHLFWLWLTLYSFYVLFLSIFLNIRNSFWFTWLSLHPYSLVNQVTPNVYLDTQKDPQDRDGTVPVLQELLTDGGEGWGRSMHMQKV